MDAEIGVIRCLNFDYSSGKGFTTKLFIKAVKSIPNDANDQNQYELTNSGRFNDKFISSIDDVFFFINSLPQKINHNHSKLGNIDFQTCHFVIDISDPPATPIQKYDGNSAGLAVFLAVLSAFFEFPILSEVAVTGSLRSKVSDEIGLVGEIEGKISGLIEKQDHGITKVILPNLKSLRKDEFFNEGDLVTLHEQIEEKIANVTQDILLIYCRSIYETIKYSCLLSKGFYHLLILWYKNRLPIDILFKDCFAFENNILSKNLKKLNVVFSQTEEMLRDAFFLYKWPDLYQDFFNEISINGKCSSRIWRRRNDVWEFDIRPLFTYFAKDLFTLRLLCGVEHEGIIYIVIPLNNRYSIYEPIWSVEYKTYKKKARISKSRIKLWRHKIKPKREVKISRLIISLYAFMVRGKKNVKYDYLEEVSLNMVPNEVMSSFWICPKKVFIYRLDQNDINILKVNSLLPINVKISTVNSKAVEKEIDSSIITKQHILNRSVLNLFEMNADFRINVL